MATVLRYATDVTPDFGLPFDRDFEKKLGLLPDDQLRKLARFKNWLDSQGEVTRHHAIPQMQGLSAPVRPFAWHYWAERCAVDDIMEFGWVLESWKEVMENWGSYHTHCICGGNRSTKSTFAARLVVWALLTIPEARIFCYQVNDQKSITEQQAYIWQALPKRFKTMARKKGENFSVQFTQKNGFSGNKLILPPLPGAEKGGEVIFGTYQQYKADPQIVEGFWAHLIWCDEEAPQKMFERLLTRLYDARGRMLLTFTTIQGWSPLVSDILGRATTLKKRAATIPPVAPMEIQVSQESLNRKGTRIYYFWTEDNPFIPPDSASRMAGRPREEVLAVCYGIPSRPSLSKFPKFDETVHVVPHGKMPWLLDPDVEVTRYKVIDPSGGKPWFILWAAVDRSGTVWAYREWPDASYGPWGEPGETAEGRRGPAMRPNGWGIYDYVNTMRDLEDEQRERMFENVIDPRLGDATRPTKEGATSIISELEDAGLVTIPAPGLGIDHGIQLITDRLAWNEEAPLSGANCPRLYISDECLNLIDALKNYSGFGGKDEVWKDPIDCLRYLLENGADFFGQSQLNARTRTFSY